MGTAPGEQPQILIPGVTSAPIDFITYIKMLLDGTIPIAGTGWEVITKHPDYTETRRIDALVGEMKRLKDPQLAALGIESENDDDA